jgi:endo-1,4-beta-mannosidase
MSEAVRRASSLGKRGPQFGVGVSVYASNVESTGPDAWYAPDAAPDFERLALAGCTLVRLFVSWRALEPQVGQYDREALARFARVVSAATVRGLQVVICFFADDRHSELSEVVWGRRRDPRTDPYLIEPEAALIGAVVSKLHADKSVVAWQLGNEAFLSGFASAAALESWTSKLIGAVREHDTVRPVGLGADAETLMRATGVDARAAVSLCDFTVAHVTSSYRAYMGSGPVTSGPASYLDGFLVRLARRGGPALLDETGPLSLEASSGEEARALRVALWSALINRAAGALARRFADLDAERREPYYLDPFESPVGVLDRDGATKPSFAVLAQFARAVAAIDLASHALLPERVGVVVPEERYDALPSLAGLHAPRSCLHAYIAAKQAHLSTSLLAEREDFSAYRLLIVPSAHRLAQDTVERLAAFVQAGGSLVASYGGGDLTPRMRQLYGVDSLGEAGPDSRLTCRIAQPDLLGALKAFDVAFEVPARAQVSAKTATVVATDATGGPLVTVNRVGQGRAVFIAVPIERAIASNDPWITPPAIAHMLREIYGAAARGAGCGPVVECDVPDVEVALLTGDADDVLVLLNHGDRPVTAHVNVARAVAAIADPLGEGETAVGGRTFGVPLAGCDATALVLRHDKRA